MKVIICEYHPWDTDFRIGNHHFARIFLDSGWDVLWISHPVSFFHGLKSANKERLERARAGPVKHPNGPVELVPYTNLPFLNAPVLSSGWVLENSHRYFRPALKQSLKDAGGFDRPDLVWITDTTMHAVADIADTGAVAVRIADDNTEFKNIPISLRSIEDKLANRADVVFVTSSPLEDRLKPKYGSKLHLLRNGVDYNHFHGEFERPEEYRDIEGPIAVYVGAIEEWFAAEWVKKLARSRSDITIVLIGRAGIDLDKVTALPNVRAPGPIPYEEIPAYLAHADCGIIPFKRTPLVESVSPLKLFEFLAAGLPVVSAGWNELERLGSPAALASDAEEFVRLVSTVIDERWKEKKSDEFREYGRMNSWNARFDSAMDALKDFL